MNNNVCSWWIFTAVGCASLFFALLTTMMISERKSNNLPLKNAAFNLMVVLTALPMFIMITFTDSGVDYYNYYDQIFLFGTKYTRDEYMEPLFFYSAKLITAITGNIHFYLFLLKALTILIFFLTIYIVVDKINFFYSVFAYLAIVYPGSFYIIRQSFASVLLCCAFVLFTFKNQKKTAILLTAISVGFHYSTVFYLLGFFLYFFMHSESRQKTTIRIVVMLAVSTMLLIVAFETPSVLSFFQSIRYEAYILTEQDYEGSGLLQIIFFTPAFYFLYYLVKRGEKDIALICAIVIEVSFLCAEMGYIIPMFIRMRYYSLVVFSVIIPYALTLMTQTNDKTILSDADQPVQSGPNKDDSLSMKQQNDYAFHLAIGSLMFAYFILRAYFTYFSLLEINDDSQLYWYHFMIPF